MTPTRVRSTARRRPGEPVAIQARATPEAGQNIANPDPSETVRRPSQVVTAYATAQASVRVTLARPDGMPRCPGARSASRPTTPRSRVRALGPVTPPVSAGPGQLATV